MLKRVELVEAIKQLDQNVTSNIKFISLLYSRLREDDIPADHATIICKAIDFDFSNVPEDDDTLSDVATEFSTYCVRVYKKIELHGELKRLEMFSGIFGSFPLRVDH